MSIFWAEFIGTLVLVVLGDGAVANVLLRQSKGYQSGWIVISAGWGFAVAMGIYVCGWASGGHINPAVTFAFAVTGTVTWASVPLYLAGQLAGGFIGAILVWLSYLSHWAVTPSGDCKLLCFATKPAIRSTPKNFMTEFIATAVLLLGVLGIANVHNGIAAGVGPYAIGILVFAIGLSLGGPTGYAINPARDLGPRFAHWLLPIKEKGPSNWDYAWVPVVAPIAGGIVGALLYGLLLRAMILPS